MGHKSYLGGSTIVSARDNPYRTDNTAPLQTEGVNNRPRLFFYDAPDGNMRTELSGMGFEFISEIFVAIQHGYIHGDLTSIIRLAEKHDEHGLGNYILLLSNMIVSGRKFSKCKGQVTIEKKEKLGWNEVRLVDLYNEMVEVYDPILDELPTVSQKILQLVGSSPVE